MLDRRSWVRGLSVGDIIYIPFEFGDASDASCREEVESLGVVSSDLRDPMAIIRQDK